LTLKILVGSNPSGQLCAAPITKTSYDVTQPLGFTASPF
jgi:hypothetical protein